MAEKAYLVVEMQKQTDGRIAHIETAFTDRNTAEQKYHEVLSFAAVSTIPIHTAVILSEEGNLIKKETYRHEEAES